MKGDNIDYFYWNQNEIKFVFNKEYGTVKVGDIFFPSIEDFKRFINFLTDKAGEE